MNKNRDPNAEQRWLELRFYYLCLDIYEFRQNFMDVLTFIESIANVGGFNISKIRVIAAEMLKDISFQPNRNELTILAYRNGLPYHKIKKYTGISRPTYQNLIQEDKDNPIAFFPRCKSEDRAEMRKFVELHDKIREAGL